LDSLTFSKANQHPGQKAAMKSEQDSLAKNCTWDLVDLLEGIKPITTKWVYKMKIGANNQPVKLKT